MFIPTTYTTYLLTPWCRVPHEKLTGLQLVKKFPAFHGTRKSITALTSVRHLSLSWASSIRSINPHPTSWISILILSTHLRLGLPSGLFPSGFPTMTLYTIHIQLSVIFTLSVLQIQLSVTTALPTDTAGSETQTRFSVISNIYTDDRYSCQ